MDSQLMFKTFRKRWWLFLAVFLVTAAATLALTMGQPPVYRSRATYVTKLNPQITDDRGITSALDSLNRQDLILGTYAEIAMSGKIAQLAAAQLQPAPAQWQAFTVNSRTIPGTRILEISVQGDTPREVQNFTTAVGDQTMKYVNSLYLTYQLELLDPAGGAGRPISPRLELNLLLALALGLFLGSGTLFLSSWLAMRTNPALVVQADGRDGYSPARIELSELQQQFEGLRIEMEETRQVIHAANEDAQLISTRFKELQKSSNGSMPS